MRPRCYTPRGGGRPPAWTTVIVMILAIASVAHARSKIAILEDIETSMTNIRDDMIELQKRVITTAAPDSTPATSDSSPATSDSSTATSDSSPATSDSSPATSASSPATSDSSPVTPDSSPATPVSSPATSDSSPATSNSTTTTSDSSTTTSDSSTATSDSSTTTSDSSTATSDSSTTTSDSSTATSDSSTTTSDSSTAISDSSTATSDSSTATSDSSTTTSDSSTATSDSSTATSDSSTATSDSSTATSDSSTTTSDSSTATSDSSTATSDSSMATSDSSTATSDSSTATSDSPPEEIVNMLANYGRRDNVVLLHRRSIQPRSDCEEMAVLNQTIDVVNRVAGEVREGTIEEQQVTDLKYQEDELKKLVENPDGCLNDELNANPELLNNTIGEMEDALEMVRDQMDKQKDTQLIIIISSSVAAAVMLIVLISAAVYCVRKKKNAAAGARPPPGNTVNTSSGAYEDGPARKKEDKLPLQKTQYGEEKEVSRNPLLSQAQNGKGKEVSRNPLLDEPIRAPLTAVNTFTTSEPTPQPAGQGIENAAFDQYPLPSNYHNQQPAQQPPHQLPQQPQQQQLQPPQHQLQPPQQQQQPLQYPPLQGPNQSQQVLLRSPVEPLPRRDGHRTQNQAPLRSPPESKILQNEAGERFRNPAQSEYEDEDSRLSKTEIRTLGGTFVPATRAGRHSRDHGPRHARRSRSNYSDDEYRSPRNPRYSRQEDRRSNRARPKSFSPNSRPRSSRYVSDSDSPRHERPRTHVSSSADERRPPRTRGKIPRVAPPSAGSKAYQSPDERRPGSRHTSPPVHRKSPRSYERPDLPHQRREEIPDTRKDVAKRKEFRRPYSYQDLY